MAISLVKGQKISLEKEGGSGIVLDLSDNPGGDMGVAIDVASAFLDGDKQLVVSSVGFQRSGGQIEERKHYVNRKIPTYRKPVAVVVNRGSASASEIVAGALQGHKRSKLYGYTTFGKGSVQHLIPCKTTEGRTRIKLTVAKYFILGPDGKLVCVHGKGITPDVKVDDPRIGLDEATLRFRIRDQHEAQGWLEEEDRWIQNEAKFRELLAYDGGDPSAYPGMDSWIAWLKAAFPLATIDPELARTELRYGLGAYLKDSLGENWYVDLQEATPGVIEAVLALGDELGAVPDLPVFAMLKTKSEENRQRMKYEEMEEEDQPDARDEEDGEENRE